MADAKAAVNVVHNENGKRLEAYVDGQLAGIAEYIPAKQVLAFVHTEVEPAFEGRGVGSALAKAALDMVREADTRYLAVCPFIAAWAARHPEYEPWSYRSTSRVVD
ncbi:GNAT family N-acetyltransferase [Streptomyces flavalbus]|uniref:GNAT family N-acetyltransferase n=1 Tax=Streptomyces flavalbus TaxID=2665155 RepID=A0ABW2W2C5_9ACTN